jgi:opacity protein-like surface antigen
MRLHVSFLRVVFLLFLPVVLCSVAYAQTDVALSVYGAFSKTVNANNVAATEVSPSSSAGGMFEVRHFHSRFIGYEGTYSFNRANQVYTSICTFCTSQPVSANAHEITGDWLISDPTGRIRPFALAGAGLLFAVPVSGQSGTQSSTTAVYVYGVGIDYRVLPHIGLRLQYRGNVHRAPFMVTGSSPDPFTHTAEPMIGAYFRF